MRGVAALEIALLPKKPPSRKPPRRGRADKAPFADILDSLDEETLARVREMLRAEMGAFDDAEADALALFGQLLDRVGGAEELSDLDDVSLFEESVAALTQVGIDTNGGDPQARKVKAAIVQKLDAALAAERLDAAGLVLIAKILNDSGWSVPETLKMRVVEQLESAPPASAGAGDLSSALADIAASAEDDPFAAYDAMNSVLVAFPSEAAARMVVTLAIERAPVLLHALAGFAMHRDPVLARAAIEALKGVAAGDRVESKLVERMVRMRPWLPAERQGPLDEAIRALRARTREPVEMSPPQAARCFVMACDGSGAGGALASVKADGGWRFVAAMTKPGGVEDVLSMEGLRKADADSTVRAMRENVLAAQTDVAGLARYLQIALGENVASQTPPPFKLIGLFEALGLGPIAPRVISAADLIAEMLAESPAAETDAAALAKAHKLAPGGPLAENWFEAGQPVERLLAPLRGPKARIKALLADYLPQRRAYWTRVVALTAFALQLDRKAFGALGRHLALVGRDIADGAALDQMPLMREIAETTVRAYESRR